MDIETTIAAAKSARGGSEKDILHFREKKTNWGEMYISWRTAALPTPKLCFSNTT